MREFAGYGLMVIWEDGKAILATPEDEEDVDAVVIAEVGILMVGCFCWGLQFFLRYTEFTLFSSKHTQQPYE